MTRWLGLDLGGTKLLGCVVDAAGAVVWREQVATERAATSAPALAQMVELAREAEAAVGPLDAIGIGFPGLVAPERGVARSSVILTEWRDVPVAAELQRRTGRSVVLDNDVHQAARAEIEARRGDGEGDFLLVAIGTGIGGAIVLGGRIHGGAASLAGEIGHVSIDKNGSLCACGRRGCVATVAAGAMLEERLGLPKGGLLAAVRDGDARVAAVLREAAADLGRALANALHLLNLPLVLLGGGLAELGAPWIEEVRAATCRELFAEVAAATRFERVRAGYAAGAIGAALHARERFSELESERGPVRARPVP